MHEADIGDYFETVEVAESKDGKAQTDEAGKLLTVRKQRPKLVSDLPPELRKAIEDVTVDRHGNFVPKLYSRDRANKGLRELLNLGAQEYPELVQQLSEQAKQLGIEINLNYSFLKRDE